tara:strand:- start:71752 stop:73893 length:2142 start_codon:yes stop_codon:yes gene_type:complete
MSNKNRFNSQLNEAIVTLNTELNESGVGVSQNVAKGVYSQESMHHFQQGQAETEGVRASVKAAIDSLTHDEQGERFSLEDNSPALQAGIIAAIASDSPADYHKQAMTAFNASHSMESLYSGVGGELEVVDGDYSQESFDETQLANFKAQNIMYNVLASRQDPFAEAFFPTKVITPAEGGISIQIDKQEVLDYATHGTDGSRLKDNRRNLIEAYANHEILNRPATEVVPHAREDGSADDKFVANSLVATKSREVNGVSVKTRPLKVGKRVNLLGISQHPGLLDNGALTNSDQLAPGMRLSKVFVSMTNEAGDTTEVVPFGTANMSRVQFRKSHEGSGREVTLNFPATFILDQNTKTLAGADITVLGSTIADNNLVVSLDITLSGRADLNSGDVEVNSSEVHVDRVTDETGEAIALTEGAGKAIVDAIEGASKVFGYELQARRSNSNWRSTGALIDVTPYTEKYAVELGYPITVLSPAGEEANGAKISGMVNAARIRNSNQAVTTLINYAESLEAYQEAWKRGAKTDIIGAARHLVMPYFNVQDIDIAARINSISSHERAEDIQGVLVAQIRDEAYRMYRDSNYGPALDMANAGTQTKPKLLIGCDAVTARYLQLDGDTRLLGNEMDYEVVSTNDSRMTDTLFLTFTTGKPGSEDGLTFGVHGYVPEMIQRVTTQRNGATEQNDRVVPRSIHVPVLPVLSRINLQNLQQAATEKA